MESVSHADWQAQGVTGGDPSLPTFDGSSTNPNDHLIELNDASMERYPDVRVYFWLVGQCHRGTLEEAPPTEIVERRSWDDLLVREGREYLQKARSEGKGFYLDEDRATDIVARNQPGSYWYRMSAASIVQDFKSGVLVARESEGCFWADNMVMVEKLRSVHLTNIRISVWWTNCMNEGVVPGTIGYDCPLRIAYDALHPAIQAWRNRPRGDILERFRSIGNPVDGWSNPRKIEVTLADILPPNKDELVIKKPTREDYDLASAKLPDLLARQGLTARDFLCEPPDEKGGEKEQEA